MTDHNQKHNLDLDVDKNLFMKGIFDAKKKKGPYNDFVRALTNTELMQDVY